MKAKKAHLAKPEEAAIVSFSEMPVCYGGENLWHGFIIEGIDGDEIEMSGESAGDVVPSPAGWTHGTHQQL